jgi:hypothetical protein
VKVAEGSASSSGGTTLVVGKRGWYMITRIVDVV